MKKFLSQNAAQSVRFCVCIVASLIATCQGCIISSVSPSVGSLNSQAIVRIETLYTSFSSTPNVYFGLNQGTVTNYTNGHIDSTVPASLSEDHVMITVENCTGGLVFQYYDETSFDLVVQGSSLRSSGGSSLSVYFGNYLLLQSWSFAQINITQINGDCLGNSIIYPGDDLGNNTIRFRTDSSLSTGLCNSNGLLAAQVSPNGYDWISLPEAITLEQTDAYSVLFLYIADIGDFGWTYAHNIGRMGIAEYFGPSISTMYLEDIDTGDDALLDQISTEYKDEVDMIILTSAWKEHLIIVGDKHPDIQYVLLDDSSLSSFEITDNTNIIWATLNQVRYLAGVVAGGMLSQGGRLCYIKAFDSDGITTSMNSFSNGVHVLNPTADVLTWTINDYQDRYVEMKIANDFLDIHNCEMSAQQSDSIDPQAVYVDRGLFAIGSNSDSRVFLGENILASPSFAWSYLYTILIQEALDGRIGNRKITAFLADGAVELNSISGLVSEPVKNQMEQEKARMISAGSAQDIFCGPIYDSDQVLRVQKGYCLSNSEIYYMNWTISGVTHLGEYNVEYPSHDASLIPVGASGFMIAIFCFLALFGVYCAYWTFVNRKSQVVMYAQPFFLYLVICGCVIGLASLVPMAIDSGTLGLDVNWHSSDLEKESVPEMDADCQAQIWLLVSGFALSYPTLFIKTWRVYKIFSVSQKQLRRVVVKVSDCCIAVAACWVYMIIICSVWQGTDPLRWVITITAKDDYGNPIESYGVCYSHHAAYFMAPIIALIVISLVYGNYLCFQCRTIQTINQETKWISLCMVNLLQVAILAIPLLLLERDNPVALFIVKSTAITAWFGGTLGLIFVPKIMQPKPTETSNPLSTGTFYTNNTSEHTEGDDAKTVASQQLKSVSIENK